MSLLKLLALLVHRLKLIVGFLLGLGEQIARFGGGALVGLQLEIAVLLDDGVGDVGGIFGVGSFDKDADDVIAPAGQGAGVHAEIPDHIRRGASVFALLKRGQRRDLRPLAAEISVPLVA